MGIRVFTELVYGCIIRLIWLYSKEREMRLDSMELHNFRCFSDLQINFNDRLTVLVGGNGAGKSTVLEAATIAAGTLTSAIDSLTNYGIKREDAHYKYYDMGSGVDVQQQFPVEIIAKGNIDNKNIVWTRTLNSAKGRSGLSSAKELTCVARGYQERMMHGDKNLILPIISYYGTGRLWAQHKDKKYDAFEKNNRSNGYIDSLDGAANDKLMMRWFQKMTIQQYQKEQVIPEYMAVCSAIQKAFLAITGYDDAKVQFNMDTNEIDVIYYDESEKPVKMPLSQLSDGYRCTISLIADIAYRMALLNPQLLDKVLEETDGIVLIDEIDLHLHPKWQRRILQDLMNIFPKVQFIVSTHAPEVINSVRYESIIVLRGNQAISLTNQTYGKDVNTILREVMDVPERPDDINDLLKKFYRALDNNQLREAENILQEIEDIVGTNDAEVNSCRVRLALELL